MKNVKTLIIGAGISGLTYANFCKEDYLIIEKELEAGGLCRTFYKDGYTWDYAGHFFHFSTDEVKEFFESRIPGDEILSCRKNTKICYNSNLIDFPFQTNIHQLEKSEFIDCLYDLFFKEEKGRYLDFEDMLYGKFGKAITEKFLKPYNEKLYACSLKELDPNAMGRFFPYADLKDIISNMKQHHINSYNAVFEYPRHGAKVFIDALMKEIPDDRIIYNSELEQIDIDNHIAIVDKIPIHFEKLISTIPLDRFLKNAGIFDDGSGSEFHANKVLVFNLGFDGRSNMTDIHWIYFPERKFHFYRVGFYNEILQEDRLSLYVEIGFRTNELINVQEELRCIMDGLKQCGIINEQKLVSYNYVFIDPAYIHVTSKSREIVQSYKEKLREHNIYTIGRYGSWTYCSIEDCILEAMALAKM